MGRRAEQQLRKTLRGRPDAWDENLAKLGIGAWAALLLTYDLEKDHPLSSLGKIAEDYVSPEDPFGTRAAFLRALRRMGWMMLEAEDYEGALTAFIHIFWSPPAQDFCEKASVICADRGEVHRQRGDIGRALTNAAASILLSHNGHAKA